MYINYIYTLKKSRRIIKAIFSFENMGKKFYILEWAKYNELLCNEFIEKL